MLQFVFATGSLTDITYLLNLLINYLHFATNGKHYIILLLALSTNHFLYRRMSHASDVSHPDSSYGAHTIYRITQSISILQAVSSLSF